MTSLAPVVFVMVTDVVDVVITCTGLALVVISLPTQVKVAVPVNAGAKVTTDALEANVAEPPMIRGVTGGVVLAQFTVAPLVAPQNDTYGNPAVPIDDTVE